MNPLAGMPKINSFRIQTLDGDQEIDIYSEKGFQILAQLWTRSNWQHKQSYELTWLGVPIIQLPEDILMMQELIYKVRPDVIVETGTAHGGTAIFYASMLELLGKGRVITVDVEIRKYNRLAIQAHPMARRITLIEDDSVNVDLIKTLDHMIEPSDKVLVALDSNHTYDHVRRELDLYASLVSRGSYIVVFDGVMEVLIDAPSGKSEWKVDNPAAAIRDFIDANPEWESDLYYNRLNVTYCENGFIRRREDWE